MATKKPLPSPLPPTGKSARVNPSKASGNDALRGAYAGLAAGRPYVPGNTGKTTAKGTPGPKSAPKGTVNKKVK